MADAVLRDAATDLERVAIALEMEHKFLEKEHKLLEKQRATLDTPNRQNLAMEQQGDDYRLPA